MIGTRFGSLQVVAKIGEGGMGEVYRATDTRLRRDVAIKVLPAAWSMDGERRARLEREAQLLAQLRHPNIAGLYGLEERDGTLALVLELAEGTTLAERLEHGALPVEESLAIARQIAEALEEAHSKGIVHRDLKPQNVKAPREGEVKVLDFGLGKAMEAASSGPADLTRSPTLTLGATREGVILGTAGYMAPEQAKGLAVDKRADIWAFGLVLYEMLTGRRLFEGASVAETMAAVLRADIDFDRLPPETPAPIRRLLRRCLERDPRNRLHDIADARLEIDACSDLSEAVAAAASTSLGSPLPPARSRSLLQIGGLVVAAALGGAITWLAKSSPSPPRPSRQLALAPPVELTEIRTKPRISPDGRALAFLADGRLWVQDLDGLTPRAIPNSAGTTAFSWSPDSRSLVFAAGAQISRTLPSGDVSPIAQMNEAITIGSGGLSWAPDDTIVFASGNGGMLTVRATGGTPSPLLEPDHAHESDFHEPLALPERGAYAYIVHRSPQGIDTVEILAGGRRRVVYQLEGSWLSGLAFSPSGHLLVGSLSRNPGVWAVPVDVHSLEARGEPFLVRTEASDPSVSTGGTLILANVTGIGQHELSLVDWQGEILAKLGDAATHIDHASLSPDGTRVALCVFEGQGQGVWVHDLKRGSRSRLWANIQCGSSDGGIRWSGDGKRLVVADLAHGTILSRSSDGSDEPVVLAEGMEPDVSRDGRFLVFTRLSTETGKDIWWLRLDGASEPQPLVNSPALEEQPRLSPDGRYLAFSSDETGRREVFLRRFPEGAGQWQVSQEGAILPRWWPDGRRLDYLQGDELVFEVGVELLDTPVLSERKRLFSSASRRLGPEHGYDVAPDGRGLVMVNLGSSAGVGGDLLLIEPWPGPRGGR